ncbi:Xyloglucanase Xgh74A [Geodia barretti]|uniref:Xyloglucanase Xgh74A n=1 Tax=Geodia barretti TaxID=519541 RepID=A0AA35W834_GEOBA|nr:Xyloglucanase Xgh74A [Geodia barretti]
MTTVTAHNTNVYVGLAGESALIIGAEGTPLGEGGMYRLTEGKSEWASIDNGLPENPQIRALLAHPDEPGTIFAGTQDGVYRTDDRGENWRRTETLSGDVWSMAVHPNDSSIMFAGYDAGRVCRSDDGGNTWRQTNTEGLVHPHITMNPNEICKRVIGLSIDPAHPDDVYGAIEVGGLIASRDGGENWSCITEGHYTRLGPVDLHGVQVNPSQPGLVYIITQLAMFRSRERGQSWEFVPIDEMFEGGSYCRDLVVDPSDPNRMYLAAGAGGGSAPAGTVDSGVLVRSTDAGETWERVDIGEVAPARMFQIAIDRNAPRNVYCCDRDGHVYCSNDAGNEWTRTDVPVEMSRGRHVYPMIAA